MEGDVLPIDADTGILDLNQNLFGVVRPRSDYKFAGAIVYGSHSLNTVDQQVHEMMKRNVIGSRPRLDGS